MSNTPAGIRWRRWAAALAVALLVGLGGAVLIAQRRATQAIEASLRELGRRLGRPVSARVALRLVPEVDLTLSGFTLGPAPRHDPSNAAPLFTAETIHVRASPWALLRGGGHALTITALEVVRPTLTVVLLRDGRSSLDDLRERPREARAASPLRSLRIESARVVEGRLRLVDASVETSQTLSVEHLAARMGLLDAAHGATLSVSAGLFADTTNLRATVALPPIARAADGVPSLAPPRSVDVDFRAVDLSAPLTLAARHRPLRLRSASLEGSAHLELDALAKPRRARAALALRAMVLRRPDGSDRAPVDGRMDTELSFADDAIELPRFEATLAGMSVAGGASFAREDGRFVPRTLNLDGRDLTLEGIEPWIPAHVVPAGTVLRGPVGLHAQVTRADDGADVTATVDLTGASVELPERLHKPPATALRAEFVGHVRRGDAHIERLGVTLGPLVLHARGEVRSGANHDLAMDSGDVPIGPLLRLLPGVRRAVPEGVDLRGVLRASGTLRTEGGAHRGNLRVALRGADVRSEALTLTGDADLAVEGSSHGDALRAELTLDAAHARVLVPERFDKPAGAPLHLHARGDHDGARTALSALAVSLPGAHVEGDGSWNAHTHQATAHLSRCAFELGALLACLPAASSRVPARLRDATARFALQGDVDTDALDRATVNVTALDLRTSVGNLHGSFDVTGLDTPRRVRADLWGDVLDGEAVAAMVPSANDRREPFDWSRAPHVDATLRADALRLTALTLASPRVELTLDDGHLRVRTLRLGVAGGTVEADGTTLSLAGTRRVEAHVRAEHLDLFALATASGTELSRRPNGSLDVRADITAEGASSEALRASADGTLHLSGMNMVMHRVANPTVAIVLPLIGAREMSGGNRAQRDPAHPLTVRTFDAPLRLEHGAIHTTSAITADTDAGAITLTGTIGADDRLALAGQIRVPPETIAQATGGQRIPGGPVPVSIRVSGTTGAPRVEVDDLGATLRALAGSRLRGIVRGIFQ